MAPNEQQPQDPTLAVVVARLDDLRTDVQGLRNELHKSNENNVGRGEWSQRNNHVDTRLNSLGREVGDLRSQHERDIAAVRTDAASRNAPWWVWVAAVLGVLGFGWSVLGPVVTAPAQPRASTLGVELTFQSREDVTEGLADVAL